VVDPTSIDETGRHAVQTNDVICSEEAIEEKTNHTCDTVLGEIVHAVVDADPELDLGGEIRDATDGDAEDNAGPRWDEARSGGSSDETGNAARTLVLFIIISSIEHSSVETGPTQATIDHFFASR
jgi:hypothetical protein